MQMTVLITGRKLVLKAEAQVAQPYLRYHDSEFLCAVFHRSPCSTDWLFLYHSMDASRQAFLPLPRSSSLANPLFLEVMMSKHGDILVLPESSTDDDGCWNAEKMVNQTESYRLFNNAISLCSFFGACLQSKRSRGWDLQPRENHLRCTARKLNRGWYF